MILILAGREKDKEIAGLLVAQGYQVELIDLLEEETVFCYSAIMQRTEIKTIIDASHPFSNQPSETIKEICRSKGIQYLRYLEKEDDLPEHNLIHWAYSWEEAAKKAAELGQTIFLTTGSNNLEIFLDKCQNKRVVIRILPEYKVIKKCQDLGFQAKDIVAMQGPFSKDLNKSIFKAYGTSVIVTRESGKRGGADNKIAAALALKIPVVVIMKKSASPEEVRNYEEILASIKKN